jgi:hypothetical protein
MPADEREPCTSGGTQSVEDGGVTKTNATPLAFLAVAWLAAAGCSRDDGDEVPASTPMPGSLPGVYVGEFPCSNCAAIAATLWLRPDNGFFLRQEFVDGGAAGARAIGCNCSSPRRSSTR